MPGLIRSPRLPLLGALLLALLPAACHLDDAPPGKAIMAIHADASWLQRDSIHIILKAGGKADTLFHGKLAGLDTLSRLPAPGYGGGLAEIIIRGFQGGQLVYEERREYDGGTGHNLSVDVAFDLTGSKPTSLDIRPDRIRLFTGGGETQLQANPAGAWQGKPLVWSTGDPEVATVSQSGALSPVGPGVTYVRAAFGDSARDASSVTVVRDPPVLDFGSDTTVAAGETLVFRVKVTQEYGDVAEFAWDLDGDGAYEGSAAGSAGQALFAAPPRTFPRTGEFAVGVRVRDGEGNVAVASKRIKVGATAPRIDSLGANPAVISINDEVEFSASVSEGGAALRSFAWDFDGDGKDDRTGDFRGEHALRAAFRYADAKIHKATLRITDAEGAMVKSSAQVTVKLDPPAADAGPDQSAAAGATVRLRGKGTDTLGRVVAREWKIGTGDFVPAADSGAIEFAAPASPGAIVCVFRVTDDDGLAAQDTLTVTVNDSKAPGISSFLPFDTTLSIKDTAAFAARAQAADADLKSWSVEVNGKTEARGALAGRGQDIRFRLGFPAPGTYNLSLKAEDQAGKSATAQARVNVVLDAPKADAGKDTTVPAGGRVNLHGKASDGMGRVIRMEWQIGAGPFTAVSKGDTSFAAPAAAGVVPCVFRVMDDDSLLSTATVNVTVSVSSNAGLSALAVSPAALAPGFLADSLNYSASVANSVASVTVTPTAAGPGTTIKVNGAVVASGKESGAITLNAGAATVITVSVTAQDGTTARNYVVTVTRGPSANADLSKLVPSAGALSPSFSPDSVQYAVSVPNAADSIKFTPTAAAPAAAIKVNGATVPSGASSGSIPLNIGANPVAVEVTAQDGVTKKTYAVTVTRAASNNAGLSNLVPSTGALNVVFTSANRNYTMSVPNATDSLKLTPTAAASGASIKVNGAAVVSGNASGSVFLKVGTTAITVDVTAPDGIAKSTYTVTVTRAAGSNADLSNLVLSAGALDKPFSSATASYAVSAPYETDKTTVTPTAAAGADAVIKVNGATVASGNPSTALPLAVGQDTLLIDVTAQDGTTRKTYRVIVTRRPPNADLSGLVPGSGALSPPFSASEINYSVSVPNNVSSFSLTPTAAASGSTIVVNPGNHTVVSGRSSPATPIAEGENAFMVTVTSQDGSVNKTYNVKVTRQPPPVRLAYFVQDIEAGGARASSSFVSSGGAVTVNRSGTGVYQVALGGMDDGTLVRGAPHATPVGIAGGYCKTAGMAASSPAGSLTTQVYCFNSAGVAADSKFSFALYPPRQAAFGYGEMRIGSSPTYSPTLSYNSAGGANSARQSDRFPATQGAYNITLGKLATAIGLKDGILVTGLGATTDHCAVGSGGMNVGGDYDAEIYCYPPGFAAGTAYAGFVVSVTGPMAANGNMGLGYALVAGGAILNSSNSAGTVSVTHVSTGVWNVSFGGLGGVFPSRPGNVQVSPFNTADLCSVNGWTGGSDLSAEVRCQNPNGVAADETFSIWAVK